MAGEVRVEADTVDEAIQKAAALLEVSAGELEIEVIEAGARGFLGFKKRPAVIKARLLQKPPAGDSDYQDSAIAQTEGKEPDLPIITGEQENQVEQRQYVRVADGKIYVEGEGLPATISCGPHFELYLNNQPVTGVVTVGAGDSIEVKPRIEKEEGTYELVLSPDGLQAKLVTSPGRLRTWKLKDQGPATFLELEGSLVEIFEPALSWEQLELELGRQQVVYGIDPEAIIQACTATTEQELIIAQGKPPQPGEDARVECLFPTTEQYRVEVGEDEKVDYREMIVRASVASGDLLAVRLPPRPGQAGISVTGKAIELPEPADIELVAGQGVEVIDGRRCIAKVEGRPHMRRLRGKVVIEVIQVLYHRGDVDLESGNLKFKGSIYISGSVTDTMEVAATQDVEIGADVTGAIVTAGGSIVVRRNCIGSSLKAGGGESILHSAEPILTDLQDNLTKLQGAAKQLADLAALRQLGTAGKVDMGYLLNVLVRNRYKKLPLLVDNLVKLVRDADGGTEEQQLVHLARDLNKAFSSPAAIQALDLNELDRMCTAVKEIMEGCQAVPAGTGDITVNYSLNCNLRASGQVKVLGRGCINSEIKAGGMVEVKGVFRGGSICAGGDVILHELGSPGGARTQVRVAEGKRIKAAKVWPNSVLQIGKRIYKVEMERSMVMAYLDSEKNLTLGTY